LNIGAHPGVVTYPLAPACAELLKDAPDLEVAVTAMTSRLVPALRSGELDLIIHDAIAPHGDLVQEYLFDDPFVTFVAANHPLARRKQVRIQDLAHERWARSGISENWDRFVEASLAAGNPVPRAGSRTDSQQLRDYLVATAGLLGYTTQRDFKVIATRYRVTQIKVKELERVRRVHVSYRKGGYLSPAGHRMIEILKKIARKTAVDSKS
jgi:DNA-binding transcriptional LysR family regulator